MQVVCRVGASLDPDFASRDLLKAGAHRADSRRPRLTGSDLIAICVPATAPASVSAERTPVEAGAPLAGFRGT
jgi:hypothetical protein